MKWSLSEIIRSNYVNSIKTKKPSHSLAGMLLLLLALFFTTVQPAQAEGLDGFIITVKTYRAPSQTGEKSTQFTIPTTGSGYNYNVDCNYDGVNEFTAQTGDVTCDYSGLGGKGIYTIRIIDNTGLGTGFPRIYFNGGEDHPYNSEFPDNN
ncbi:MAG: hypothetical protein IMF09_00585 [Proteobacteria bacterium]|nr:hypothetical protein [Pseudomonadota bacterium]